MDEGRRPRLRPLESFPVRRGGRVHLAVRDPEGLSEGVLVASPALALLLTLIDGTRDARGIAQAWKGVTGEDLGPSDVERVLEDLDRNFLLEGGRAEGARAERLSAYRALPRRVAAHAGESYPEEAPALREFLSGHVRDAGEAPLPETVTAVVAPHIDLRGGGPCHGAAARALARSRADTFVVLGTAHAPLRRPFALTNADFDTPLGPVATDRDVVARLVRRGGGALLDDELAHVGEHSVEFQAVWLRHLHGEREGLRIVPVLVGSIHEHVVRGTSPAGDPAVSDFVGALRELVDEAGDSVAVVASIDLAHVGPRYGDPAPPDPAALERVREADAALLRCAVAADPEAWIRRLHDDGDAFHVCGAAPTYVLLKAIEGRGLAARLLRHDRWEIDPETGSHVSFAAVAYGHDGARPRGTLPPSR
jgi:AmmeMemoRadiSam system protein B